MAPTFQTMTQTNTDTQIDIDTLACQHLGVKQCDLNKIKLYQFKKHSCDFNAFPNVVTHDAESFDPVKIVSEYLRLDPDELTAIKENYALKYSKRRECARECHKRKMAKLSDEERKALYKQKSRNYYNKNAELVKERNMLKYNNDEEYRLKLSLQNKDKYQRKKLESKALSAKVDVKTNTDNNNNVKTNTDNNNNNNVETEHKPNKTKIYVSHDSLLSMFEPPECTKLFRGITKDFHKYQINYKHPDGPRLEINDIYLNNDGVRYEYCDWKD